MAIGIMATATVMAQPDSRALQEQQRPQAKERAGAGVQTQQIKRYLASLKTRLKELTQAAHSQPNGEPLWASVRLTVSDVLQTEWHAGRLQGTKPEQAYFVKCDRSTMTQNDLDNGRLIFLVGVAPVRPSEFEILRITQETAPQPKTLHRKGR